VVTIYVEGGSQKGRDLKSQCRYGFFALLEKCGFTGPRPTVVACGPRSEAFKRFKIALGLAKQGDYVAMWIDSEDLLQDIDKTWSHLKSCDGWTQPAGATDEQVLFMTTCMETLIVADRQALKQHYGAKLQESALPPLHDLEVRERHAIQDALSHATRNCSNAYAKGKRSFAVLAELDPDTLERHLPSFQRSRRILNETL